MALPIEDYALIGDMETAALIGRDGSVDWMCMPRFDSDACFAALLGDERHGRWLIAPVEEPRAVRRRYLPGTLVLETEFETAEGSVRLTDCMPPRNEQPDLVRVVEGVRGRARMRMVLALRPGYGRTLPWIRRDGGAWTACAGPDAFVLQTPAKIRAEGGRFLAEFEVVKGDRVPFLLVWQPSHLPLRPVDEPGRALARTEAFWEGWSRRCCYRGPWREEVLRSLITLKALTYAPTGGVVAAPTTSLPEWVGGNRNWDYRYCWLRDATFTFYALMDAGYLEEARAWRDWLLRAVAGDPEQTQVVYGLAGERRLGEFELAWLPGYMNSRPVRIGNRAVDQLQLDVFGEVMDCLHQARLELEPGDQARELQRGLLEFLESHWKEPDEGIWEVRGPKRLFTHSKVMAWVAFDRAVRAVEGGHLDGPVERWRALRDDVHAEVCQRGYHRGRRAFTQFFGSDQLDASLLLIPLVGFLPPGDERVRGTVEAIERELLLDGLVRRYLPRQGVDGLAHGEGAFLACSFWLVDARVLEGRHAEAERLFRQLLSLRSDLGLLSEEFDVQGRRLTGNFPQAFSHVALVNSAMNLGRHPPAARRGARPPGEPGRRAGEHGARTRSA